MANKKQLSVQEWIFENAVLVSTPVYKGCEFNLYQPENVLWLVEKELVPEFLMIIKDHKDSYHQCKSYGVLFQFITPYGCVKIVDFIDPSNVVHLSNVKFIKLEVPRELYAAPTSRLVTQLKGVTTEAIVKKNEELVKEKLEYQNKVERYTKELTAMKNRLLKDSNSPALNEAIKETFTFDHSYGYSDDIGVYRDAKQKRKEIEDRISDLGGDGPAIMKEVIETYLSFANS